MKKRNITALLLALTIVIGGMIVGCGDSPSNNQETGIEMNETQEESDYANENTGSDGTVSNKLVNPLGDDLEEVSKDMQEKVDSIVEKAEKLIEEKKEGN